MTIAWSGLSVGAIYVLVAIGYNIPLSQTGIFNFAQGQFVVFGVFLSWYIMGSRGWPWWAAIIAGAVIGALIGAVEELVAIRPLRERKGGHGALVTTVGAAVVIQGLLLATWAQTPKSIDFFAGNKPFSLLGGRLDPVDLWLIGLALVLAVGMHLVSHRTFWGLTGRAATDDADAARMRGVNVTMLRTGAFALAGALGCAIGPFVAPKTGVDVSIGLSITIFSFVALAVGGFGSYLGCLLGGLFVGLVQSYTSRYFGSAYPPVILFLVLLSILLLKPTGLFGQRGLRAV